MSRPISEIRADIDRLKSELIEAEYEKACAFCQYCQGNGWVFDTTYDRTGVNVSCQYCYGTGLGANRVRAMLEDTFRAYRKPVPKD